MALKNRVRRLSQLLVILFDLMRAFFGLRVVERSKNGGFHVPFLQRILAVMWLGIFVVCLTYVYLYEEFSIFLNIKIKNSLIVRFLPKISAAALSLTLVFTYILTHAFANERKQIVEEVMQMCPHLDRKNVDQHPRGTNYVIAVGITQTIYSFYWTFAMDHFTSDKFVSYSAVIVMTLPKLVSACFLVDYVSGVVVLLQQFVILNEELREMRERSLESKHYPMDERIFEKRLNEIADRHKAFTKIGNRMNQACSFQLLLNISALYALIVSSSYIALYALISSFTEQASVALTLLSILNLVLNGLTFLLIVEVTTQLSREVSDKLVRSNQSLSFRQMNLKSF